MFENQLVMKILQLKTVNPLRRLDERKINGLIIYAPPPKMPDSLLFMSNPSPQLKIASALDHASGNITLKSRHIFLVDKKTKSFCKIVAAEVHTE